MERTISVTVDGETSGLDVRTHHTPLTVLCVQLGLKGAREGCGIGMCGACTVLVDGQPISSRLAHAAQAGGNTLLTIEGLEQDRTLDPVQDAYLDANGFQCAFCTSAFILAAKAPLEESPEATDQEVSDCLTGHFGAVVTTSRFWTRYTPRRRV